MINCDYFYFMHINEFLGKAVYKSIARPNHVHMYSDQRESSVFVK